jgi:hypothetical protein
MTATAAADQSGDFLYANLLTLLGTRFGPAELRTLGAEILIRSRAESHAFAERLDAHLARFRSDPCWPDRTRIEVPAPTLSGWRVDSLEQLRQRHGGLLLALFHHGAHRNLLADLALQQVDIVAPVSAEACSNYGRIGTEGPTGAERALQLLPVSDRAVGRRLLSALRRGRIGVIYADGSMGPGEGGADEQGVQLPFLGATISAKAGIARLSHAVGLPILPLIARSAAADGGETGRVVQGALIEPSRGASIELTMRQVFAVLEQEILRDPAGWEFATYAHRWIVPHHGDVGDTVAANEEPEDDACVRADRTRVATLLRADDLFWVDVHTQRAVRIPADHVEPMRALAEGETLTLAQVTRRSERQDRSRSVALLRALAGRALLTIERAPLQTPALSHRGVDR